MRIERELNGLARRFSGTWAHVQAYVGLVTATGVPDIPYSHESGHVANVARFVRNETPASIAGGGGGGFGAVELGEDGGGVAGAEAGGAGGEQGLGVGEGFDAA